MGIVRRTLARWKYRRVISDEGFVGITTRDLRRLRGSQTRARAEAGRCPCVGLLRGSEVRARPKARCCGCVARLSGGETRARTDALRCVARLRGG